MGGAAAGLRPAADGRLPTAVYDAPAGDGHGRPRCRYVVVIYPLGEGGGLTFSEE